MPDILHDPSSYDSTTSGFTDAAQQLQSALAKLMGGPCAQPGSAFHAGELAEQARGKVTETIQRGADTARDAISVLTKIAEQVANQKQNWSTTESNVHGSMTSLDGKLN